MSFYIYQKTCSGEATAYQRLKSIKFTGKDGLFARYLAEHKQEDTPFAWVLSEDDLLQFTGIATGSAQHSILVDLMPEALLQVCLYRLHSVRGVSHYDETDLALCLNPLFEGNTPSNAAEFRQSFTLATRPGTQQMLEALSLTGGLYAGNYRWSAPKMNLGAAVRPAGAVT